MNDGSAAVTDPHSLAAAYALDAVDDLERRAVERHLPDCAECRDDVRGFSETASRLASGVAQPPPPSVRDAVMAEIGRTRQSPPPDEVGAPRPQDRGGSTTRLRWLSAAAAALFVAAVGSGSVAWQTRQEADQVIAESSRSAEQARALADRQTQIAEILADDDRTIAEAPFADGGSGTVVVSGDRALFVAAGVQAPPDGSVLQLWMIDEDPQAFRSAGVLTQDGAAWSGLAEGLDGARTFGVTVEPAGGSAQPTTEPVVVLAAPA